MLRFTRNETGVKLSSPSPSPPTIRTPDISHASPPFVNGNIVGSPPLDAISTTSFATSISPNTREWTRGISAGMAGSPGNLISLVGESPPTAPSSYEDSRGMSGWSSPRHGINYHGASASPRRPLSFQMDGNYSPSDVQSHIAASSAARRSSMQSQFGQMRPGSNPPLPHHPQAHFYGVPDIDLDPQSHNGIKAGDKGYYFGFDTIPAPNGEHVPGRDNVVIAGYEGGLEVSAVGKRGLELIANLRGLRGGVYNSKILPWTVAGYDVFPLIAVVIHGPNIPPSNPGIGVENGYDAVSADRSEAMANVHAETSKDSNSGARTIPDLIDSYQTTVEVYSLKTGRHVGTLLEAPRIPVKPPITSPIFKAPAPTGAFQIHADGGNIVVSSGVTGECWVYRQAPVSHESPLHFRCHGKIWTTLQQPPKGDAALETDWNGKPIPPRPRPQTAILSLNSRWIAYCPATPSSQISLRAIVPAPAYGRAPGLTSMTTPQLPAINAEAEPMPENFATKLMRDTTQEFSSAATWAAKQGKQFWGNLWSGQSNQSSRSPPPPTATWGGIGAARQEAPQFPPTHGAVTPPVTRDPGLVSLLDIDALGSSTNVHPFATFSIPNGCSFLSFSPTSTFLFSATSKGDVQSVWDLMRIQYTKASPLQTAGQATSGGPQARQVAHHPRMTVARVVDLAWTKPNGEKLAMVTERGTVHLLDMPSGAFTWPPPRRRAKPQENKNPTIEGPTSAVAIATSAFSSVREVARPLMSRPRRSNSNSSPLAGASIGEYAIHGGKLLAAGVSQSLGKTGNAINQLRHNGENRVSLPGSASVPGSSCVAWITGRKDHSLFVLGGGLVRTFPTQTRKTPSGGEKRGPRLSRYQDFKLSVLPDNVLAPYVKCVVDPDEYLDFAEKYLDAGNETMVLDHGKIRRRSYIPSMDSSIPQAEIESSAPYQPFHTDRRVVLYEIEDDKQGLPRALSISSLMAATSLDGAPLIEPTPSRKKKGPRSSQLQSAERTDASSSSPSSSSSSQLPEAWAFGQAISAVKLDLGLSHASEDDSYGYSPDDLRALPASAMERILHHTGAEDDEQDQIVVTTRRRRGMSHADNLDDDGFFEDDCEVLDFADRRV